MDKCKICGKPKGRNKVYCSNKCRRYDPELRDRIKPFRHGSGKDNLKEWQSYLDSLS